MLRLQLLAGCIMTALMGAAHAAVFSVGHVNGVGKTGELRFANILSDDLRGWDFRRGHYVVREPGYYYISFHGLSQHDSTLTLGLFRNGQELLAGYGSGTDYATASSSGVVPLRLGDKVSLRAIKGVPYESSDSRRNYFGLSGFRISSGGGGLLGTPQVPGVAAGLAPTLPLGGLGGASLGGAVARSGIIGPVVPPIASALLPSATRRLAAAANVFSPLALG